MKKRPPQPSTAEIFGVRIDSLRPDELIEMVSGFVKEGAHALVLNVNVHCMNLAYETPWLREFLNSAEVVFADGHGVVLAARFLGRRLPGRITPADWIGFLVDRAEREGHTLFLLGAHPEVVVEAAQRLRESNPRLAIVGVHHGYFDKRRASDGNQSIVAEINHVSPDILLVGFGMPMQEQWLKENWEDLRVGVALPVGGLFDLLSGHLRRPPSWMQRAGLEWLGRLTIEPRRLWRRYVVGNPKFVARVLREKWVLARGKGGPSPG